MAVRILPSCWDGKKVTWRCPIADVLRYGVVTAVTEFDKCYIDGKDGKKYFLPMYMLVRGWIRL